MYKLTAAYQNQQPNYPINSSLQTKAVKDESIS